MSTSSTLDKMLTGPSLVQVCGGEQPQRRWVPGCSSHISCPRLWSSDAIFLLLEGLLWIDWLTFFFFFFSVGLLWRILPIWCLWLLLWIPKGRLGLQLFVFLLFQHFAVFHCLLPCSVLKEVLSLCSYCCSGCHALVVSNCFEDFSLHQ